MKIVNAWHNTCPFPPSHAHARTVPHHPPLLSLSLPHEPSPTTPLSYLFLFNRSCGGFGRAAAEVLGELRCGCWRAAALTDDGVGAGVIGGSRGSRRQRVWHRPGASASLRSSRASLLLHLDRGRAHLVSRGFTTKDSIEFSYFVLGS
jgi:hypothetical protein